jgi:deazaflavin-dependent oxidoreductase (nitroreductase family)
MITGRYAVDAAKPAPAASTAAAWGARLLGVRWLVRAPIVLYRARLGFLFGSRLLLLEHIGRKSGARRYALLEVVGHSRPGTYMVASGFGARAQWYRNIQVNPRVRVSVGSHKPVPATARPLSAQERNAALAAYAAGPPRPWARLKPVLEASLGAPIDEQQTRLPMIALEVADEDRG